MSVTTTTSSPIKPKVLVMHNSLNNIKVKIPATQHFAIHNSREDTLEIVIYGVRLDEVEVREAGEDEV